MLANINNICVLPSSAATFLAARLPEHSPPPRCSLLDQPAPGCTFNELVQTCMSSSLARMGRV